jgi:signal peptidase I
MSEQKTIKLKFNNKETEVQAFDTYQELFDFFCKNFTIDDDKKKNLSLFYYDEDGDQIAFQQDNDYIIFIRDEENQKVIEGEITENDNQDNSMEKQDQEQDPMKSGTIFKKNVKEQTLDLGIKNIDSASLANSLYSIDSISSAMVFKKGNEDFAKTIDQLNEYSRAQIWE